MGMTNINGQRQGVRAHQTFQEGIGSLQEQGLDGWNRILSNGEFYRRILQDLTG
jgi:hypothetical protein